MGWQRTGTPGVRRDGKTDRFQVRCMVDGRRTERIIRGTYKDAQAALAKVRTDVPVVAQGGTFGALLDEWRAGREGRLSPNTLASDERIIRVHIRPALGDRQLSALSTHDLDKLYAALTKGGLAPASVRKVHNVCRGALDQARKWKLIATNPALDASPPSVSTPEVIAPSPETAQALLSAAWENNRVLAALFQLSLVTGARRGEVVGLRWEDVDLTTGSVTIRRALIIVKGGVQEKSTKTDRVRSVALDDSTVAMLATHRAEQEAAASACGGAILPASWVFSPRPGATEPYRPDSVTWWFEKLRRKTGVTGFSWKDSTRHFSATQLVGAGVDPVTVAGRLGHSRVTTTLNIYSHALPEKDRDAAALLGGIVNG